MLTRRASSTPPIPLVDDEGELLFLSKLFEFADGLVDIEADPILSQNNFVFNQTIIPTEDFPTETIAFPGDYNHNGTVDAADYVVWRHTLGQSGTSLAADGDGSGTIDQADYDEWCAPLRSNGRQRHGCQYECRGSRTSNTGAADDCGGWLVSPATSSRAAQLFKTHQRVTLVNKPPFLKRHVLEVGRLALEGESVALRDRPEVQSAYLGAA